jgi:hypothetical protein
MKSLHLFLIKNTIKSKRKLQVQVGHIVVGNERLKTVATTDD